MTFASILYEEFDWVSSLFRSHRGEQLFIEVLEQWRFKQGSEMCTMEDDPFAQWVQQSGHSVLQSECERRF
jgi:hypothetical protein